MELVVVVVVVLFALLALLAGYVSFTTARLDRLRARRDAAYAVLETQLLRRATLTEALPHGLLGGAADELRRLAERAREAAPSQREAAENDLSRALHRCGLDPTAPEMSELADAAVRVGLARQFYNDAVRDTRALQGRPLPQLLHLDRGHPLPAYFEIDDSGLAVPTQEPATGEKPDTALNTMDNSVPETRERP